MSVLWQIGYNGEIRPLAQWGIESVVIDCYNQAKDTCTLVVAGTAANDDPVFAFDAMVVILRNGTPHFTGVVSQQPYEASASRERAEYILSGPWVWLEETVFQQPWHVLVDPRAPIMGRTTKPSGKVALFQSSTGAKQAAWAQAHEAVDYAISRGAPFTRGSFGDLMADAPWEKGLDLSCAEVLKRCCRWTRDAVAYWDYSNATPILQLKRRYNLTNAAIDLDNLASGVLSLQIRSRPDLVPRGVLLRFARTITNEDNGSQWIDYVEQTAGHADGGRRVLSVTLQLSGTGAGAEPVPIALATHYYASLIALQWQGTLTIRDGCSGLLRPGKRLNIANGKAGWATMSAVVQHTTEDLVTGVTTAEFGPPEQLGAQDFLDQLRLQKDSGGAGTTPTDRFEGTPEEPAKHRDDPPSVLNPSTPPDTSAGGTFVTICENGSERTIFVPGY